jgi:hypothetical protein
VPIVLKSGSLNLLEPSGPVKACNGIALPFTVPQTGHFTQARVASEMEVQSFLGFKILNKENTFESDHEMKSEFVFISV